MKVLFATGYHYLPQRTGGIESSTHELCLSLINQGHKAGVICNLSLYDFIWIKNRIISKIRRSEYVKDHLLSYPVYRGYGQKDGVDKVFAHFKPDIVVAQVGKAIQYATVFSEFKIPVIIYQRDVEFGRYDKNFKVNTGKIRFIANSNFTAQKIKEHFGLDAFVLPPLIDLKSYQTKRSGNSVLHIGLTPEKGIDMTIALAKKRPDIKFLLLESWPVTKSRLNFLKSILKENTNVKILRRTCNMRKIYGLTKLLIVPSICDEAWGRVVNEAQTSGIPVIASNKGGLPESVGCGGITLPHEAPIEEWERVLSSLVDDEQQYELYSKKALERVAQEDISKEKIIESFTNYVKSMLN